MSSYKIYSRELFFEEQLNVFSAQKKHIASGLKKTILFMFKQISEIFYEINLDRKNFPKFEYILYHIFEKLGENSYLQYLPPPSSKYAEYSYDYNAFWIRACQHLGWEYVPNRFLNVQRIEKRKISVSNESNSKRIKYDDIFLGC